MSISWPPGPLYLAQTAHLWAFPPLLILLVHQYAVLTLPTSIWVAGYLLAMPAVSVIKGTLQSLKEQREMTQLGARKVPLVASSWPGALDRLYDFVKSFKTGYPGDCWSDWNEAQGHCLNLRALGQDLLFITEPDHIKAILSTEFDSFEKGETFRWFAQSMLGSGVFNADGDMWKFHRAMTRPFFARDRVTDFDMFDRHADLVISQLKERFVQGEAIDFQDIMSRFTLDCATEFLFGSDVHSLHATLPYAHNSPLRNTKTQPHFSTQFAEAFSQAQAQISLRMSLGGIWPFLEFWKDKTKDPMNIIYNFIDPILKDALAKKGMGEKSEDINQPETLLDHLVSQTDDPVIIRDETLNILLAGRDTTMATLTFAMYCLSQHPSVLETLREEILQKIGPKRRPTFDDIKDCKLLRGVVNETLRLYPPVPFDRRHSKRTTTFSAANGEKPFYVPGHVEVIYSIWLMHRRKDLWGPDADIFDPMRFLDERLKYLTSNPFIFLPFNAGPRICLGQQFAYNEVSFMLIRLLQSFDTVTLVPDAQPPESRPPASWKMAPGTQATDKIWPKIHLTLYSHMGLWLKMGEATYADTA